MQFHELGIVPAILTALQAQGYKQPSPIQEKAIPSAIHGRDLLGLAQTGTGKTCAFAVPILQQLMKATVKGPRAPRALIVTPTRELAIQIDESFQAYGANLPGLRHAVIFGGVGQQPQVNALKRGIDILVATPGRLLDLHNQGLLDLTHISMFVLDEADRMLDMGFLPDVRRIIALLPEKKQTMLFSATMPPEVSEIADKLLHDPVRVQVAPVSSPVEVIAQQVYFVDKNNKSRLLVHLLQKEHVDAALIFTRTKHGANKVAADLEKAGIPAAAIHGNKSQTARVAALKGFKSGELRALVATDIAARGIDIDGLSYVFNYNLPEVPETYIHRIGRTGRAGKGGTAISFCSVDEKPYLKEIEKLMKRTVMSAQENPYPMEILTPSKGKNAEDEEARAAARERKRARTAAQQNRSAERSPSAAQAPKPNARKSGQKHPKQKPQAAKPEAQSAQPQPQGGTRKRLSNNFVSKPTALEGEKIMDATARMLSTSSKEEREKAPRNSQKRSQPRRKSEPATGEKKTEPPAQKSANKSGQKQQPARKSQRSDSRRPAPRGGRRPPQPAPEPEHSPDFKPFYLTFDD